MNPRDPALNYVVVAGVQSPGRAVITGATRPFVWEVTPGFGLSGARSIFRGRGIAEPTLTVTLWRPEQFIAWKVFAKLLEPPTMAKPLMLQMEHPLLADADIKAVGVKDLGTPERQTNGTHVVVVKLIEYRPPVPAAVKPRGAIPSPSKGVPLEARTEVDRALDAQRTALAAAQARAQ